MQAELRKSYWMTVLDTSVLVHDPYSIFKFGSVYISRIVIHELDGLKKGRSEEARNAREASRLIQHLIDTIDRGDSRQGIPLANIEAGVGSHGRLFLETIEEHVEDRMQGRGVNGRLYASLAAEDMHVLLEESKVPEPLRDMAQLVHQTRKNRKVVSRLYAVPAQDLLAHAVGSKKKAKRLTAKERSHIIAESTEAFIGLDTNDDKILKFCMWLKDRYGGTGKNVRLITKDVNLYIYAWQLGIHVEDYEDDRVEVSDLEILTKGMTSLSWDDVLLQDSFERDEVIYYRFEVPTVKGWHINQGIYMTDEASGDSLLLQVVEINKQKVLARTLLDRSGQHHEVYGIRARNPEQNYALNVLMDPDIDLVVLDGAAGTGKTLLALAAGLEQTHEYTHRLYERLIMTRVPVPLGEDIGFLPGTEEEKMNPWMGALGDNMEVLIPQQQHPESNDPDFGKKANGDVLRNFIQVKSMSFMRGRSFMRKWIILDEAQNATPKQIKALITRAGEGTKFVVMGNIAQIDNPYLNARTNGLSHLAVHAAKWPHAAHVVLQRKERSRLASWGEDTL